MRSTVSLDQGLKNLRAIRAELGDRLPPWNEADTRFHFIDRLLIECFGWPREIIRTEQHFDGEYRDYVLGNPGEIVWEAKRAGAYFDFPADKDKGLIQSLKSVMAVSETVAAAIRQAQGYCNSSGIEFAVISNGTQLVAFIGQRIGASWLDGRALVCRSLEQLEDDFPTYWQCLSADGLFERRLATTLGYKIETNLPRKLSSRLMRYPSFRYKSDLQANLRAISELLLEDIVRTEPMKKRFYNECYADTGALSRDALISQQILKARYASLFPPQEGAPSLEPARNADEGGLTDQILTEALAKRPIVLLGDVGVGKTSFLEDLIYIRAAKEFEDALLIYVDLGSKAALNTDIRLHVLNEIERQLYGKHHVDVFEDSFVRGAYDLDIKRFRNSFRIAAVKGDEAAIETEVSAFLREKVADKSEHLRRAVEHLSLGRKKQIIFMVDNADQRTTPIQQEAFLISQELAQNWNALVFIAVRPQTFFQSKRAGVLAAYPHKVFTIEPPRPEIVIEKRLLFALKVAEGKIPASMLQGVRLSIDSMAHFLKALLYSLEHNRSLTEILANISGGNIRAVVEFVTQFIGSPNVEAEKIVRIQAQTGKYNIALHEFSKAAILGDYSHFNPNSSLAMNLFDVQSPDPREHFLCSLIVAFLMYEHTGKDKDEFVETSSIMNTMQALAFIPSQIEGALRRLTNKRLIETTERITFEEDVAGLVGAMPYGFRVTTVGAYHLRRWLGTFAYLDAVLFDTPIFNEDVVTSMSDHLDSFEIQYRLERTTAFRNYLTAAWDASGLRPPYFDWHATIKDGQGQFDAVQNAVQGIQRKQAIQQRWQHPRR